MLLTHRKTLYFFCFSFLLFIFANERCYGQEWKTIKELSSSVEVQMPIQTNQSKATVFLQNRPTVMTIYAAEDNVEGVDYFFTILKIEGEISKKRSKKILQESLVLTSVRHVAKAFKQEKIILSNLYPGIQAELVTSNNYYLKLRTYIVGQHLITLYIISEDGPKEMIFEDFLSGLKVQNTSNQLITIKDSTQSKSMQNWKEVVFDDFKLSFPISPFEQKQVIINGNKKEEYVYYFANDQFNDIAYLINTLESPNVWNMDLSNSQIAFSLAEQFNAKIIDQKTIDYLRFPASEFILSSKYKFYRVRYYFDGKKMYQLIVQGSFPTINSFQIEQFFDSFALIK